MEEIPETVLKQLETGETTYRKAYKTVLEEGFKGSFTTFFRLAKEKLISSVSQKERDKSDLFNSTADETVETIYETPETAIQVYKESLQKLEGEYKQLLFQMGRLQGENEALKQVLNEKDVRIEEKNTRIEEMKKELERLKQKKWWQFWK
jgi:chromosome segregation ATPase